MAGRLIKGAAALSELVRPASETDAPGLHRMLPVVPELSALLPGRGLRRGSTVAVAAGGTGTVSLMLALLSAASRAGSWCAVIGVPDLGALAAEESGIALDRLALIPNPGPDWPTVAGALIDGVDLVVVAVPAPVAAPVAARLAARARQRGSILLPIGEWPGADLTLRVTAGAWEGLGQGHGRLRRRRVTVLARGRGAADRPREATMWLPGAGTPPPIPPPASAGPSAGAPVEPDGPSTTSDVVDLSVDGVEDRAVPGLRAKPGAVGVPPTWRATASRPGGGRAVGARGPGLRRSVRRVGGRGDSRPVARARSRRHGPARGAVPVWWEFVPAPVSDPGRPSPSSGRSGAAPRRFALWGRAGLRRAFGSARAGVRSLPAGGSRPGAV